MPPGHFFCPHSCSIRITVVHRQVKGALSSQGRGNHRRVGIRVRFLMCLVRVVRPNDVIPALTALEMLYLHEYGTFRDSWGWDM